MKIQVIGNSENTGLDLEKDVVQIILYFFFIVSCKNITVSKFRDLDLNIALNADFKGKTGLKILSHKSDEKVSFKRLRVQTLS